MSKRYKIKVKKPWIAYPGSTIQQNYAEALEHGYIEWNIRSGDDFDVEFRTLPNPKPFVTVDWAGTVSKTYSRAKKYPYGSRFRIRSTEHISHKDCILLKKTPQLIIL